MPGGASLHNCMAGHGPDVAEATGYFAKGGFELNPTVALRGQDVFGASGSLESHGGYFGLSRAVGLCSPRAEFA